MFSIINFAVVDALRRVEIHSIVRMIAPQFAKAAAGLENKTGRDGEFLPDLWAFSSK
jgi:hypothetical protein